MQIAPPRVKIGLIMLALFGALQIARRKAWKANRARILKSRVDRRRRANLVHKLRDRDSKRARQIHWLKRFGEIEKRSSDRCEIYGDYGERGRGENQKTI